MQTNLLGPLVWTLTLYSAYLSDILHSEDTGEKIKEYNETVHQLVRFQVLMAISMKTTLFRDVVIQTDRH
jgi:hypothetical protein